MWQHSKKAVICKPGRQLSPGTLILHFQPPELLRSKCPLLSHAVYEILLQQPKTRVLKWLKLLDNTVKIFTLFTKLMCREKKSSRKKGLGGFVSFFCFPVFDAMEGGKWRLSLLWTTSTLQLPIAPQLGSDVTVDMEGPKGIPTKMAPFTASHQAQNRLQPVGHYRTFTPHGACPFQH